MNADDQRYELTGEGHRALNEKLMAGLTPHETWILKQASEQFGREITPGEPFGALLLRIDRRTGGKGGGLSSRSLIAAVIEIYELLARSPLVFAPGLDCDDPQAEIERHAGSVVLPGGNAR